MNRRQILKSFGTFSAATATLAMVSATGCRQEPEHDLDRRRPQKPPRSVTDQPSNFDALGRNLTDEICERASHFFFDQADPETGLVFDRAHADGSPALPAPASLASIAATGFGLSALCIAASHGYLQPSACEERILKTLTTVARRVPHQHGFLLHYLDARTCRELSPVEFSSIDTALLLAGALHAGAFLNSKAADALVAEIYQRVDWPWMTNGGRPSLVMGWEPDHGFQQERWDSYSECLLMYLLAIGSPTHPLPVASWDTIKRNTYDYGGIRFISSMGALFIHQYPHVWLDLRGLHDGHTDYFQNSISAMRAHKTWCMLQHGRFDWIDERTWGFSASDTPRHSYSAWGAPPAVGEWDGTLSPHAAAGGLALMPEECIVVLKAIRDHYPQSFSRYGFVNALNPGASGGTWYDPDIISIDLGLTMLMVENQRSGAVRATGTKVPALKQAMAEVGFRRE